MLRRMVIAVSALLMAGTATACQPRPAPPRPEPMESTQMTKNPTDASDCSGADPIDVAAARAASGPVAVRGYVFVEGEAVVLSTEIRESYPAQPGEITMAVRGLKMADLALERVGGIAWTPRPVVVRGAVQDSTLTVDPFC